MNENTVAEENISSSLYFPGLHVLRQYTAIEWYCKFFNLFELFLILFNKRNLRKPFLLLDALNTLFSFFSFLNFFNCNC